LYRDGGDILDIMARKYFGTDGIRGRANGIITPELALKVGMAAGLVFQNGDHRHRVLIGKDTRLSGYDRIRAGQRHFSRHGCAAHRPVAPGGVLARSIRADLAMIRLFNPFGDNGISCSSPMITALRAVELRSKLIDEDLSKHLASPRSARQAH
jgi:phosphoglucosamine mutase